MVSNKGKGVIRPTETLWGTPQGRGAPVALPSPPHVCWAGESTCFVDTFTQGGLCRQQFLSLDACISLSCVTKQFCGGGQAGASQADRSGGGCSADGH